MAMMSPMPNIPHHPNNPAIDNPPIELFSQLTLSPNCNCNYRSYPHPLQSHTQPPKWSNQSS
jgi:hypothetical protein